MKVCIFKGCKEKYYAKKHCKKHYFAIILRGGYKKRKCKIRKCKKMIWGRSELCNRHIDRLKGHKPMNLKIDCRKGKYNPNYHGGVSLYKNLGELKRNKIIKIKQNKKCQNCGTFNTKLQIHHIDGSKDNHSLNNLIVLCQSCHKLLYHRFPTTTKFKKMYGYTLQEISKNIKRSMWKTYLLHLEGLLQKI